MEALQVLQKNGGLKNTQLSPEPECATCLFRHSKMVNRVAQGYTKPSLTVIWIRAPWTHYEIIREPILTQKSHLSTLT